jgi:hypothetical protein
LSVRLTFTTSYLVKAKTQTKCTNCFNYFYMDFFCTLQGMALHQNDKHHSGCTQDGVGTWNINTCRQLSFTSGSVWFNNTNTYYDCIALMVDGWLSVWNIGGMMLTETNRSTWKYKVSQCHSVYCKSQMDSYAYEMASLSIIIIVIYYFHWSRVMENTHIEHVFK